MQDRKKGERVRTPAGVGTVEIVDRGRALIKLDANPMPHIAELDFTDLWFPLEQLRDEESQP